MAREIIMDADEFQNIIEDCIYYIFDDCDSEEKAKYWAELFEILNTSDDNMRWAKLIKSELFENAIGEWDKIDGYCLWIKD